jgi:hypothetical protein
VHYVQNPQLPVDSRGQQLCEPYPGFISRHTVQVETVLNVHLPAFEATKNSTL